MLTDVRNLGGAPSSRDFPGSRRCKISFLFLLRVLGVFRADGAPPFVRGVWCPRPSARSDSFATPMAKGSRVQVVGSVREAPGGLPCVALFWYFSLDRERKVHISISPINCNFPLPLKLFHQISRKNSATPLTNSYQSIIIRKIDDDRKPVSRALRVKRAVGGVMTATNPE